jgi:hypothetical protein
MIIFLSEEEKEKSEKIIIYIAIASFILHLLLNRVFENLSPQ